MKKTCPNAFSLMEMMIVLLIVAIIAAATAPMVTKKMTRHADRDLGNGESLWEKVNNNNNIIQPINGGSTKISLNPVVIGDGAKAENYKETGTDTEQGSVAIGAGTDAKKNSIVLGVKTERPSDYSNSGTKIVTGDTNSVVISGGYNTHNGVTSSAGKNSIAIGRGSYATGNNSIAIGRNVGVVDNDVIQIGAGLGKEIIDNEDHYFYNVNKVNIGNIFKYENNKVTLGSSDHTVYIPGNLIVGGRVVLGKDADANFSLDHGPAVLIKEYNTNRLVTLLGGNKSSASGTIPIDEVSYSYWSYSDRRLKNVGEKFEAGLEELKKLDFFNYTFKDDINKTPRVGVIAQDLQKVFPNAVTEGEDGYLRIRMEDMFYAVINAVKELDTRLNILVGQVKMYFDKVNSLEAKVEAQQQEIEALKAQNAEFEERLAKLEKRRK